MNSHAKGERKYSSEPTCPTDGLYGLNRYWRRHTHRAIGPEDAYPPPTSHRPRHPRAHTKRNKGHRSGP
jgi:hypothetical protein